MRSRILCSFMLLAGCGNQVRKEIPNCRLIFGEVAVGEERGYRTDPCRETSEGAPEMLPSDFSFSNLRLETPWFLTYRYATGELIFAADEHTPRSPDAPEGVWNVAFGGYGYKYGDVEGAGTYQVWIRPPAETRHTLWLEVIGEGVVEDEVIACREGGASCAASYAIGETIALAAKPDEGWTLDRATGCEALLGGGSTITADTTCTIAFRRIDGGASLSIEIVGPGAVHVVGTDFVCRGNRSCRFDVEGSVALEARGDPELRGRFVGWQGCASGSVNPLQLSIEEPTTCIAVFERETNECVPGAEIVPGVLEVLDASHNVLGTSNDEVCSIQVGLRERFSIRAQGFTSSAGNELQYVWDIDKQDYDPFVADAYGLEIPIEGDGRTYCRGVYLQVTDACGAQLETFVTFEQR